MSNELYLREQILANIRLRNGREFTYDIVSRSFQHGGNRGVRVYLIQHVTPLTLPSWETMSEHWKGEIGRQRFAIIASTESFLSDRQLALEKLLTIMEDLVELKEGLP
ncbi:hypothetical protein PMIN06_000446 [Paraphaeosphaeria minitans]